jgi:hypothetical protein
MRWRRINYGCADNETGTRVTGAGYKTLRYERDGQEVILDVEEGENDLGVYALSISRWHPSGKVITSEERKEVVQGHHGRADNVGGSVHDFVDLNCSTACCRTRHSTTQIEQGCEFCMRPERLRGKSEQDGVYELFSAGRVIVARPLVASDTPYSFLVERLTTRIATTPADTIRLTPDVVRHCSVSIRPVTVRADVEGTKEVL